MLAMQDKKDAFRDGLKIIDEQAFQSPAAPLSLSLGALAVDCYGGDNRGLLDRLNGLVEEDTQVRDNVFYRALAGLANLTRAGHNPLCLDGRM